ncbi:MAG: N-acetylmuramoyl-L-alanine amidase [Sedimentibacter sp.]|uniref:N-acetylmuramoyl-L-alanine amidase n=1 Tax=Sedimentibacter sp. TaxID=1960295 RepID=UPI002981BFD1|nr:N-acetylmuramoyl-L-alanine amidase [Sedimentibacter sp.]MDW5298802.1 N-acetylmuramoyl-L-alanine amidase [Sedimentibacter sp.]
MEVLFKKVNIVFSIALVIIVLLSLFFNIGKTTETINASEGEKIEKIKILIDPGHGGVDQGASGNLEIGESTINLAISEKLMHFLEGSGFEVEMTRYDDNGLYTSKSDTIRAKKNEDLKNRVEAINNSHADLVVSVHINYFPEERYYGAQVFYQNKNENGKIAAKILQDNLKDMLDTSNTRVPQVKKGIKILDDTNTTVILIECGFLSNIEEEKKLVTDEYQEKTAWAIYTGLLKYFNKQMNK